MITVSQKQYPKILDQFGDIPENIHVRHFITNRQSDIYLSGSISNPRAIVVRPKTANSELFAYIEPIEIYEMVVQLSGWNSILVDTEISHKLGGLLAKNNNVSYLRELYFVLNNPIVYKPIQISHHWFEPSDRQLLKNAYTDFHALGMNNPESILDYGIGVGIILKEKIVAIAFSIHMTEKYADIGIFTLPTHQNLGYSTALATLLIDKLQRKNITPVWSTDEKNPASLKIARKLGFKKIKTKIYINLN
jgi:GNAT superfamily N-acetyltransferase